MKTPSLPLYFPVQTALPYPQFQTEPRPYVEKYRPYEDTIKQSLRKINGIEFGTNLGKYISKSVYREESDAEKK